MNAATERRPSRSWPGGVVPAGAIVILAGGITTSVRSDHTCRPCAAGYVIAAWLTISTTAVLIDGQADGWWLAIPAAWIFLAPLLLIAWVNLAAIGTSPPLSVLVPRCLRREQQAATHPSTTPDRRDS